MVTVKVVEGKVLSKQLRAVFAEFGRKGGSRNSPAQRAHRVKAAAAMREAKARKRNQREQVDQ